MNNHVIPSGISDAATNKLLWSYATVNSPESDRYLRLAKEAETQVIGTPAASPDQIIAKLAMLMDWESEHLTASGRALLQSAIADLEGVAGIEPAADSEPEDAPQLKPAPKRETRPQGLDIRPPRRRAETISNLEKVPSRKPAAFRASSVKVDGRSKPVILDGVLYPSITAAIRDTGMTAEQVRRYSRPF